MVGRTEALDATALLVGQGVLAEALSRRLSKEGIELERAPAQNAAQIARVAAPDLVVLVGDAASDGGKRVLSQLEQEGLLDGARVIVLCGADAAKRSGLSRFACAAALSPDGGLDVCARRLREVLARLLGDAAPSVPQAVELVLAADSESAKVAAKTTETAVAKPLEPVVPPPADAVKPREAGEAHAPRAAIGSPRAAISPPRAAPQKTMQVPALAPPKVAVPSARRTLQGLPLPPNAAAVLAQLPVNPAVPAVAAAGSAIAPSPEPPKVAVDEDEVPTNRPPAKRPRSVFPVMQVPTRRLKKITLPDEIEARLDAPAPAPVAVKPEAKPTEEPAQSSGTLAPEAPTEVIVEVPLAELPSRDSSDTLDRDGKTPLAWTKPVLHAGEHAVASLRKELRHRPLPAAGAAVLVVAIAATALLMLRSPASEPSEIVTSSLASQTEANSGAALGPKVAQPVQPAKLAQAPVEPASVPTAVRDEAMRQESEQDDADDSAGASAATAKIDPRMAAANKHVAQAQRALRQGRMREAEAAYSRALGEMPGYPRALAGLVRTSLARKDGRAALGWAQKLVAKQPNRGANQLLLGDAYALRGDRELALVAWKRARAYGNATAKQRLRAR